MAKAADQFRASDVTLWAVVALVTWAVAVFGANVSGLIPPAAFAGFHASRIDGATMTQLRDQVAELTAESSRMRRENDLLIQRFEMAEQARGEVARRVGAIEVSLPRITERVPQAVAIDQSVTASIVEGRPLSFEADGGSVSVRQRPFVALDPSQSDDSDAGAPEIPVGAYGVALGFPVAPADAEAQWQGMLARVGTLLIGMWPLMADVHGSDGKQVIAGPIASQGQAAELCVRLDRVGIPCSPADFDGDPLPLLN